MTDQPKICVAICNYNHEQYLLESLLSITRQDYQNLDIVVIDDGSDAKLDHSSAREIVEQVNDDRVRFHRFEQNQGKWQCLNYAFSTTDASVCTAHDADDVSLSWRISSQMAVLSETQTAHNLCGFVHCWNEQDVVAGLERQKPTSLNVLSKEDIFKSVLQGFQHPGCNHYFTGNFETAGVSAMFLRDVWNVGFRFLPPKMGLRVLLSEDSDFNCRVTLGLKSTSILAETPYLYRRNTSTNTEEV